MYQTLVAEEAGQLDFPHPEAKPTMGVSMDETVRGWGGVVVAGSIASTPGDCAEGQCVFRAAGRSCPSHAQEQTESVGILWRRGDLQRVGRVGNPSDAVRPDHSSDFGSAQASDTKASGPIPEGGDTALSHCRKAERHPPGRLHRGALFGCSSSRRYLQPEGWGYGSGRRMRGAGSERSTGAGLSDQGLAPTWYSEVFADGQRHEPDRRSDASPESGPAGPIVFGLSGHSGFYPGEAARLQCGRRAVQRPVAREGLAAVSISDPVATSGTFARLSGGLQCLPETEIDPPRQRGSLGDLCAISAEAPPFSTPAAALSWTDLVHTEP